MYTFLHRQTTGLKCHFYQYLNANTQSKLLVVITVSVTQCDHKYYK